MLLEWAQIKDISVELPSDTTVLPQTYTLHAIKIGYDDHNNHLLDVIWYYESGSTSTKLCSGQFSSYSCSASEGIEVDYGNGRHDYVLNVTWNGEIITSDVLSQSSNTGDHEYRFYLHFGYTGNAVKRNEYCTVTGKHFDKIINIKIFSVPETPPSSLTEVNKTATTITVNWTAIDSSDADGYVVNVTSDTDTVLTVQVEGSSNNTITLNGLRRGTTYSITVRAYQQLLGPASTISVQTLPGIATAPFNVLVTLLMYF